MAEPEVTAVLCLRCEYRFQSNTDRILDENFKCPKCHKRHFSFPDEPEYTMRDPEGNEIKVRLIGRKKLSMQFVHRSEEGEADANIQ